MPLKVRRKDQLFQKLRRTVPAIEAATEKATEKSATELVDRMRSYAPVDEGTLRNSILWEFLPMRNGARVFVHGRAFYARFVEFGRPSVPAQPFFFPAYRLLRKRIRGRFSRAINAEIKKVVGQ